MHRVTLTVSNKDRSTLTEAGVDMTYVCGLISLVINTIKPTQRAQIHRLRLCLVDTDYSYYTFANTLYISKEYFNTTSKNKRVHRFLDDTLHELGHYIQFKIDKICITNFIVDIDKVSHTKYINNATERQARNYSMIVNEASLMHNKMQKLRIKGKSLSNLNEKSKDQKDQESKS